ncbi:Gldg family protein [Pseudoflavitalea rhizosphaerae]|uniref:Gldg family protein n=1 Tax=Pseudoflavitalea rhizosphaerae TaxID=1884793 RepID=UPI000F8EA689|nr:Gldg family protein [Pseudoflavitalea rhizosphaerae]
MKVILKIAGNELRTLFYSPIAWFTLIVFWVQVAVIFTGSISSTANYQEIMEQNSPLYKGMPASLTMGIFIRNGFFQTVIRNLYLFIPLLTMGLISNEVNSGSVKLLYSSPVQVRQIVLGKYLGIVSYCLLLLGIVAAFVITGMANIRHVDYGMLLSALLGFYLIVCAYAAIGLLMSALTNYQIVSALSCFVTLFFLGYIGFLWQKYDILRDLTYQISLQNRTEKMVLGLITTKDLIYFIIVSGMFVAFTMIKLKSGREMKPWYIKTARYLGVLSVTVLIGYLSSRPAITGYFDTTAGKINTIHPRTQELLKQFGDSTLEVTLYTNLLGSGFGYGLPENRNSDYLGGLWDPFLRFRPDIKFKYEYYYDTDPEATDSVYYKSFPGKSLAQIAAESADAMDIDFSLFRSPEEMRKTIDLKPEAYRLVLKLSYKGRTEFVRTFDDPEFWPNETNLAAAFKRLTEPKASKVYFVSGQLERSIHKSGEREYGVHSGLKLSRYALVNIGFDADTINLDQRDIPADADLLVIADPKTAFSDIVFNKLKQYIDNGGNCMIAGEPGKQPVLNPLLQQLGVQLMDGQLVAPTEDETPDKIVAFLSSDASGLSEKQSDIMQYKAAARDSSFLLMPGATAIRTIHSDTFDIQPLAGTLPNSAWLKTGRLIVDSTLPDFNAAAGDLRQASFPTIVQLTKQLGNKEQRIIVYGDADLMSNTRLGLNLPFVMEPYSWMVYNRHPLYLPRPAPKDLFLDISARGAQIQRIAYVWVLPGIAILLAAILLIRRKRQ